MNQLAKIPPVSVPLPDFPNNHHLWKAVIGKDKKYNADQVRKIRAKLSTIFRLPDFEDDIAPPRYRVGDMLQELLNALAKVKPTKGCRCSNLREEMNNNGIEWCRESIDRRIVPLLVSNLAILRQGINEQDNTKAKALLVASAITPAVIIRQQFRAIVNKAISRAEDVYAEELAEFEKHKQAQQEKFAANQE